MAACVPVPAVAAGVAFGAADLLGAPRRALAAGAGWLHQIDHLLSHPGLPGGRLLAGADRLADPRQRPLAAAPDGSYQLPSEPERRVFRALTQSPCMPLP